MWLHEARFRARSPWVWMVLWQAIALAGGLSMVGAPIIYGLSPFGVSFPEAVRTAVGLTTAEDYSALATLNVHPWHLFSLCLGLVLGAHLVLTLARTFYRVRRARSRHRQMVRLLSTPLRTGERAEADDAPAFEAQVIEHDAPLAYCLPGRTNAGSVTVLSRGLLDQLTKDELAAVVAHEQTHLRQRHHLLTMAFEAWYRALPWLPTTRYGREAVLELTEMLADDGALTEHSNERLLRSIATTSTGEGGARTELEPGASGLITGVRLQRLLTQPETLGRAPTAGILAVSLLLLTAPTALILFG